MKTRTASLFRGLAISLVVLTGCSPTSTVSTEDRDPERNVAVTPGDSGSAAAVGDSQAGQHTSHPSVSALFQPPVRLRAGDEFVSVEAPGYACPTMADVDGDGQADLVVGQFANGNLQFYKNTAAAGQLPQFAAAQWLTTAGERAVVPGVW